MPENCGSESGHHDRSGELPSSTGGQRWSARLPPSHPPLPAGRDSGPASRRPHPCVWPRPRRPRPRRDGVRRGSSRSCGPHAPRLCHRGARLADPPTTPTTRGTSADRHPRLTARAPPRRSPSTSRHRHRAGARRLGSTDHRATTSSVAPECRRSPPVAPLGAPDAPSRNAGLPVTITDRLLTPGEAAEYLACSPRQVRRFVATGELRATRLGPRMVRFQVADLEALISQRSAAREPPPWPDRRVYRVRSA